MDQNPLKVLKNLSRREIEEQKFEKLWRKHPEKFDPNRNAMERERIARTMELIPSFQQGLRIADLGCGIGVLSLKLRDQGAIVDAVDISKEPLKKLESEDKISTKQEYIPKTSLKDEWYDGVLCTELIAYLPPDEYRLLFSELSRIVKPSAFVVCSTPLDYRTENPLQRFASLMETEFDIDAFIFSYHLFYIRLRNFFESPTRYIRANRDADYRNEQIARRGGFSKAWFRFNSHAIVAPFWLPISWISRPFARWIRQSRSLLLILEKCCRFIWNESGITHVICLGRRRTLEKIDQPVEPKHKKEVWE